MSNATHVLDRPVIEEIPHALARANAPETAAASVVRAATLPVRLSASAQ
jgi:hypothetical protein